MSPLVAILILLLLAAVILVVAAPLRAREPGEDAPPPDAPRAPAPDGAENAHAELEAAREAKYREIRDSELDYRTGKLSAEDYAAIDAQLRAEAIDLLKRLDRLDARAGEGRDGGDATGRGTPDADT
jgi:hypothetical protein